MELPNLQKVQSLLDNGKKQEALIEANRILNQLNEQRLQDAEGDDVKKSSDSAKLYVETSQELERMGVWS